MQTVGDMKKLYNKCIYLKCTVQRGKFGRFTVPLLLEYTVRDDFIKSLPRDYIEIYNSNSLSGEMSHFLVCSYTELKPWRRILALREMSSHSCLLSHFPLICLSLQQSVKWLGVQVKPKLLKPPNVVVTSASYTHHGTCNLGSSHKKWFKKLLYVICTERYQLVQSVTMVSYRDTLEVCHHSGSTSAVGWHKMENKARYHKKENAS